MKMLDSAATFYSNGKHYHADNCQPLEAAAENELIELYARSRGVYPGKRLDNAFLTELLSVGLWDSRRKQDWRLDTHRNEGIEITYLAKGNLRFGVDGSHYNLKKGEITLTRPWQPHYVGDPVIGQSSLMWLIIDVKVRRPDDTWQWPEWIILSPEDLSELTDKLQHTEKHVWASNQPVRDAFAELIKMLRDEELFDASKLAVAINHLLITLLGLLKVHQYPMNKNLSSKAHTVERFLNALPALCGEDWSLDLMASECALKRSQFTLYCQELKGMSPLDYLKNCRINLARQLLSDTQYSVTEIGLKTGFGSSQYFATVFKQSTRQTPREYREQNAR